MAQHWAWSRHWAFRETKTLTTTRWKTRRSASCLFGGLHHLNNLKVDSRVSPPWWMLPTSATLRCLSRPICVRVHLLLQSRCENWGLWFMSFWFRTPVSLFFQQLSGKNRECKKTTGEWSQGQLATRGTWSALTIGSSSFRMAEEASGSPVASWLERVK